MEYKELGLSKKTELKEFNWEGNKIYITKYLPIESKYDIVMITLQESLEDKIYNPIKLDMCFHVNLVLMYTDLVFTDEEKQDISKLYDEMKSTGFLNEFLKHIDEEEYKEMQEDIENISQLLMKYNMSAAGILAKFIDDLPANAEAAQKILDGFDPEKYQNVIDFARNANGGRPIPQ